MSQIGRLILTTTLLACVAGSAAAQSTYKDRDHHYQLYIPKNWEGVPVELRGQSSGMVSKWVYKRAMRGYTARIHVFIFDRPKTSAGGAKERPVGDYDRLRRPRAARSFDAWVKRNRPSFPLDKPKQKKVRAPKNIKAAGKVYEGRWKGAGTVRSSTEWYSQFLVVTTDDKEYVVECYSGGVMEKKLKPVFSQIVKSFKLITPSKATQKRLDKAAANKGNLSPREEARERARADARRVKGWRLMESKNYFIVTNMKPSKQPFVEQIRRQLEGIRKLYEEDFPSTKEITAVSIVRLCDDRDTYSKYGGPSGTGGYWFAAGKELVLFGGDKNLTKSVLNHEAFHQYIFYACGKLSPHSWYNEGYGDYYAGAEFAGSKIQKLGAFRMRVPVIKQAIKLGTYVPIKDIIKYEQRDYYSNPQVCYAEGWSIIYFLNRGLSSKKHPWRKILPTYLAVLQETRDKSKAVDAAFEGVDLDRFEQHWKAFIANGRRSKK
ncbi:MAG: hypothetical protein CMJ90_02940 [Planctomycetes bacterium]|nr:hypothetical protein [Planctomycetota bacterium]